MPLTSQEEAEFTPVNALAFDLIRVNAQKANNIPPCWLCMSEECKEEGRQNLYRHMQSFSPNITGWNASSVNMVAKNLPDIHRMINLWKQAEMAMKDAREAGNPKAFFAA